MSKRTYKQLQTARSKGRLVSFPLPHQDGTTMGYVVALSKKWLVLTTVSDGIHYDGFECHRVADLFAVDIKLKHRRFYKTALRRRQEARPQKPAVDPRSTKSLLRTANDAFPLVTIHREIKTPGYCRIGQVLSLGKGRLSLHCIEPGAVWENKPKSLKLKHITRIDFAGDYEDVLYRVGGDPP